MLNLPLSYSLRNIRRRPWRSVITVTGVAVVVFAAVLMLSLSRGLSSRLDVTGDAANLLLISQEGQNIMFSSISEEELVELSSLPGLAYNNDGEPLISGEVMHNPLLRVDGVAAPIGLRGVNPIAYEVHSSLRVVEGHLPEEENEVIAGRSAHIKLGVEEEALAVGKTVLFEDREWIICGRFEDGGSLIESELWMNETTLKDLLHRRTHTFVVMRLEDSGKMPAALQMFRETGAFERFFKGWSEKEYYQQFAAFLGWVFSLSLLMVIAVTVAGALIGANTMYTAVMNRMKEISTQRILGFGKLDILVSLLTESLALALIGGVMGVVAGLFINGLPLKLSYGAFYLVVDWMVIAGGIGLAVFIGVVGGLCPVIKGLRMSVVQGLKYE